MFQVSEWIVKLRAIVISRPTTGEAGSELSRAVELAARNRHASPLKSLKSHRTELDHIDPKFQLGSVLFPVG